MVAKTKMLTVAVNADYAAKLDDLIKRCKTYSSRSEFLKDAIREKYGFISIQRGLTFSLGGRFQRDGGDYLLNTPSLSR